MNKVLVRSAPAILGATSRREENLQKTTALSGAPNATSAQPRARVAALAGTLLGLFALSCSEPAFAYCRLTTDQPAAGQSCAQTGIPLAWHRQCISYSVKDPGTTLQVPLGQIRDTADVCFKTWTAVSCNGQPLALKLAQTAELAECETPEYNPHGPNANTIAFISNWSEYESASADAFGLTLVWHNPDTGEIYDADIQLNETLGPITICGAACSSSNSVDLQNVLTHEAGHFLGLGHSNVLNATMSARATLGETSKRDLATDDKQAICDAYGSLPAPMCTDQDFVPNHGFSPSCASADTGSGSSSSNHSFLCSAAPIGRGGSGLAGFWLALVPLYLATRRVRTGRSSARPKPR